LKAFIHIIIFFVLATSCYAQLPSQPVKVFSRYNYYLSSQQTATIICVFPDSISPAGFNLVLKSNGHLLKSVNNNFNQRIEATISIPTGFTGELPVECSLLKAGKIFNKTDIAIAVRAYKSNAVQIDELTGGLVVGGTPFFPFGFYCVPVGDLPEREVVHGFNMIGPYQDNLPESFTYRKNYMDRCAQLGVKVQYSVNSVIGSGHNGSKGLDKTDDEKLAMLKNEIIAFRDHPALLSWYINDEPDGQGRPPKVLEDAYKLIHELDPYHPVSIVFMMPQKAHDYQNTMDIAMTDPYPIPGPANSVMDYLKQYSKAYQYQKSVWLVPQAFGGQEMWAREPTAHEIRLITYMGLVSGAKGIQYYVHAAGNLNPQSVSAWSACSDIAVETAQMTPFLLSCDNAPIVSTHEPDLFTRTFSYKGNLLVMVVNNQNTPRQFNLKLAATDTSLTHIAELWFENRSVPFKDGNISDMIDAYGSRVYLIRNKNNLPNDKLTGNNMMLNPGFEQVTSPGLPIGSNVTVTSRNKADVGATFFADATQSFKGLFSLRLITPVDSGGKKIRFLPLVMNKDNSYTVSIWAKAKKEDHMPAMQLAIDAMQQVHTFPLNDEWEKYSFTFTAPVSSANTILTLDLPLKGIAWFDEVNVSPDPVITYKLTAEHKAIVSVASSSANTQIRYAFDKLPGEQSALYKSPVNIGSASIFYTTLYKDGKVLASSKLFIPVNKALGKKVQFNSQYDVHYTAAGPGSLTDGQMGTTAFKDGKWLGFSGANMDVTLDMGTVQDIKNVTASFLGDPNSGIFLPSAVEVYTSADGSQFALAGVYQNTKGSVRGEPYLQQFTVGINQKQVRYIHIVAKTIGAIPDGYLFKGTTSWLFADEILVK